MKQIKGRVKGSLQYDFLGKLYAGDAVRVGKYGFPQLKPVNSIPQGEVRGFNYLLTLDKPEDYWIHCFVDDYQFERLWNGFDRYIALIKKTKGFISTDFSLYRDYDDDWLIWNCYRNRVMAYALQSYKKEVIPTAGFGAERTWDWCFEGLPDHSVLAVTTNGIWDDIEAKRLFVGGIECLVDKKHPTTIVVCGNCPAWMKTKYPDINICSISNYSQQWKRRCG